MKPCRYSTSVALAVLLFCGTESQDLCAQTSDLEARAIGDIIDSETLCVIRVQPENIDFARLGIRLRSLFPSVRSSLTNSLTFAADMQKKLKSAGVREVVILFTTHSGPGYQPVFCVRQSNQRKRADVANLIPDRIRDDYEIQQIGAFWVAAPQPALERMKSVAKNHSSDDERVAQEFLQLVLARNESVRVVARVSEDHKRAIRERDLALPDWLGGGSMAEALAPIKHVTFSAESNDEFWLELGAIPPEQQQVGNLEKAVSELVNEMLDHIGVTKQAAVKALDHVEATGDGVLLALSTADGSLYAFAADVAPSIDRQLAKLAKSQAELKMRKITLMIHNHASAFRKLPPAGGVEKDEVLKGNLSWRVHALPFIGDAEAKLYQQFHLDEDWDSEHNKQFISTMPALFLVPNSKLLPEQGLSNFCVPTGEKTMWPMDRIITFDDITDGIASTIAVLEVRDELAQIWTKPEPLEIDPNRLAEQLGGHFGDEFLMSTANGAFAFHPLNFSPKVFAQMLTRNAGD